MDCLFCKIIKGEIPSVKIFENEKIFAFLDVNPLTEGHCLVIPKQHYENIFDIDKEVLKDIIAFAKDISENAKKNLGATGVQLINASGKDAEQAVFHFHLHIVPRYSGDNLEINKWWQSRAKNSSIEDLRKTADKLLK